MPLKMALLLVWAALALLGAARAADDWSSNCSAPCKCKWISSRKTADCSAGNLSAVPNTLSAEIQQLNLSSNPIPRLTDYAFDQARLVNLQKLYLRECGIEELHERALAKLSILIELDLSANRISALHPDTFATNERLRIVLLSHNRIRSLPDGLFRALPQLQTVELQDCLLEHVAPRAFEDLPQLKTLRLDSNRLAALQPDSFQNLRLKSLSLLNNPWRCDCQLAAMVAWAREKRLVPEQTECAAPEALKGQRWGDVGGADLLCQPRVAFAVAEVRDGVAVLSCQVEGVPQPEAQWVHNTSPVLNGSRFSLQEGAGWLNLSIELAERDDWGDYVCVAKSVGGLDERNVSVLAEGEGGQLLAGPSSATPGAGGGDALASQLPLVVGLASAALLLVVVIIVALWFFCGGRRRGGGAGGLCRSKKVVGDGSSSNGDLSYHAGEGSVILVDQQKSLLTKVNPVRKPPRRIETGPGDLSDVKASLLDDGMKMVPSIADSEEPAPDRSLDSLDTLAPRSTDGLSDCVRGPPDLLSFPSGRGQVSPAGSSASTAPDSTRLPVQHQQQVAGPQSPLYHHPHLFGTLPYSRSQSPFSPAAATVPVAPRGGYVTIPRRPRVPSWSSPANNPLLLLDPLQQTACQPAYDNLGPRTTADGSSMLSLNKSLELPGFYSPIPPIEEQPAAPPPQDWARNEPEGGQQQHQKPLSPVTTKSAVKVPPKPPPKPKKKTAAAAAATDSVSGPLYEDEGEDGTEV